MSPHLHTEATECVVVYKYDVLFLIERLEIEQKTQQKTCSWNILWTHALVQFFRWCDVQAAGLSDAVILF